MRRGNSGIDSAALKAEKKAMVAKTHAKQLKKQLDDREELELSRKSEERNTAAFATGAFTAAGMGHFFSHVGGFVSSLSSIALGGDLGKTVGVENQSISTAIAISSISIAAGYSVLRYYSDTKKRPKSENKDIRGAKCLGAIGAVGAAVAASVCTRHNPVMIQEVLSRHIVDAGLGKTQAQVYSGLAQIVGLYAVNNGIKSTYNSCVRSSIEAADKLKETIVKAQERRKEAQEKRKEARKKAQEKRKKAREKAQEKRKKYINGIKKEVNKVKDCVSKDWKKSTAGATALGIATAVQTKDPILATAGAAAGYVVVAVGAEGCRGIQRSINKASENCWKQIQTLNNPYTQNIATGLVLNQVFKAVSPTMQESTLGNSFLLAATVTSDKWRPKAVEYLSKTTKTLIDVAKKTPGKVKTCAEIAIRTIDRVKKNPKKVKAWAGLATTAATAAACLWMSRNNNGQDAMSTKNIDTDYDMSGSFLNSNMSLDAGSMRNFFSQVRGVIPFLDRGSSEMPYGIELTANGCWGEKMCFSDAYIPS